MLSALSLSLVLSMTSAQDMFTPPKEVDQLNWMQGNWKGKGKGANPGGEGEINITGSANCKREMGRWVAWTGDYNMQGMGTMDGRMMLTYNPESKKFEGQWYDNMTSKAMSCTGYIEGKHLVLWSEEIPDQMVGGMTKFKIVYTNVGKNKLDLSVKFRMGETYVNALSLSYTK